MALTPNSITSSLVMRPELNRLGPSKLAEDVGAFKTMLTSQLGANSQLMGKKLTELPSSFGEVQGLNPLHPLQGARGGHGGHSFQTGQTGQTGLTGGVKNMAGLRAKASSAAVPLADPATPRSQGVKGSLNTSQVRSAVDLSAHSSDDLGHLPGAGRKGQLPAGFTKDEEDLIFAAAAAETKFLAAKRQAQRAKPDAQYGSSDKTGVLSATYESGSSIDAIGYDGKGGTSYGKYQIASGVGTMGKFVDYLRAKAPDMAARLENAGPANTGGRHGAMVAEWKRIAAEQPKRFEALQQDFIKNTHYDPALKSVTLSTGEDLSKRSQAVREVLWSTAVQHGPNGAAEIFSQAIDKLDTTHQTKNDKALIEEVYTQRMNQFGGRGRTRGAVASRLADEKESALAMLNGKSLS